MEKWLDAYSQWPAMHQMIFSLVCVLVCLVLFFLFGIWSLNFLTALRRDKLYPLVHYIQPSPEDKKRLLAALKKHHGVAVCAHGFENSSGCPTCHPELPRPTPVFTGIDWRVEQQRMLDEQALLQEELEKAAQEKPAADIPK